MIDIMVSAIGPQMADISAKKKPYQSISTRKAWKKLVPLFDAIHQDHISDKVNMVVDLLGFERRDNESKNSFLINLWWTALAISMAFATNSTASRKNLGGLNV